MNVIIIDGNNLIHKIPSFKSNFVKSPDSVRKVLMESVRTGMKLKTKTIFVFDGFSDEKITNAVFSGSKTADEIIRKYIEDNYESTSIKVVSSDRGITELARVCGCEVSTSENFWNEINQISPTKGKNINHLYNYDKQADEKPNGMSKRDFNEYMKHFT